VTVAERCLDKGLSAFLVTPGKETLGVSYEEDSMGQGIELVAGCDPHLDGFTVAIIDRAGRRLETVELGNRVAGWETAVELCRQFEVATVGIEGASGYGLPLARTLSRAGVKVIEVPTRLTARLRKVDGASKTDVGDASAIGRAVLSGQGSEWKDDPDAETLRIVSHRRDELVRAQTQEINRLRALLAVIDSERAQTLGRIRSRAQLDMLAKVRYGGDRHRLTVAALIRLIASGCRDRLGQIRQLETDLEQLLPPAGHALIGKIEGIGTVTAAALLAEMAGTDGFATDAKMAAWAGTAPLDASSGRQQHHRLNRSGNRQANRAIHTIALTQLRHHGPAADYIAHKMSQGKTRKEALRAVKRHITRQIWKTIRNTNTKLT
jgi:transposase